MTVYKLDHKIVNSWWYEDVGDFIAEFPNAEEIYFEMFGQAFDYESSYDEEDYIIESILEKRKEIYKCDYEEDGITIMEVIMIKGHNSKGEINYDKFIEQLTK